MTDFEKEEFWKALGRLYDASVELRQASEENRKASEEQRESIQEQREMIADLYRVAELHQRELQAHEKRHDRSEVILQWLAEAERKREKPGAQ